MEQFVIQSRTSSCRKREGGVEKALKQDIIAFYHSDYRGGVEKSEYAVTANDLKNKSDIPILLFLACTGYQ
ncbi:hypothetical protein [Bacteroides faecis]|uniref:hypothetical protein n=1 Tax=Bacteroides faecis TaxID=674529 RepID=UPI003DA2A6B5